MQHRVLLIDIDVVVVVERVPEGCRTTFLGVALLFRRGHQSLPCECREEDGLAPLQPAVLLAVQRAAAEARVVAERARPVVIVA